MIPRSHGRQRYSDKGARPGPETRQVSYRRRNLPGRTKARRAPVTSSGTRGASGSRPRRDQVAGRAFRQHGPPFRFGVRTGDTPGGTALQGRIGPQGGPEGPRVGPRLVSPRARGGRPRLGRGQGPEPRADLRHAERPLRRGLHRRRRQPARRQGRAAAHLLEGAPRPRAAAEHPVGLRPGRRERPHRAAAAAARDLRPRRRGLLRRHGRALPDSGRPTPTTPTWPGSTPGAPASATTRIPSRCSTRWTARGSHDDGSGRAARPGPARADPRHRRPGPRRLARRHPRGRRLRAGAARRRGGPGDRRRPRPRGARPRRRLGRRVPRPPRPPRRHLRLARPHRRRGRPSFARRRGARHRRLLDAARPGRPRLLLPEGRPARHADEPGRPLGRRPRQHPVRSRARRPPLPVRRGARVPPHRPRHRRRPPPRALRHHAAARRPDRAPAAAAQARPAAPRDPQLPGAAHRGQRRARRARPRPRRRRARARPGRLARRRHLPFARGPRRQALPPAPLRRRPRAAAATPPRPPPRPRASPSPPARRSSPTPPSSPPTRAPARRSCASPAASTPPPARSTPQPSACRRSRWSRGHERRGAPRGRPARPPARRGPGQPWFLSGSAGGSRGAGEGPPRVARAPLRRRGARAPLAALRDRARACGRTALKAPHTRAGRGRARSGAQGPEAG